MDDTNLKTWVDLGANIGLWSLWARREYDLNLLILEKIEILLQISRIARQVFCGPKLRGIDEYCRNHDVALCAGAAH